MKSLLVQRILIILFIPFVNDAGAQWLQRIEINPSSASYPSVYTEFKGKLYLTASDGYAGTELFMCDTNTMPLRITDLNPGTDNSFIADKGQRMLVVGDKLYMSASDGSTGFELFMYDGVNPPKLVKEIIPGFHSSLPAGFTELNGIIYFAANSIFALHDRELWSYNPITNNLAKAADVNPGTASSNPTWMTAFNGKLYFNAEIDSTGNEFVEFDPSTSTVTVYDIKPGKSGSNPLSITNVNGTLYFTATHPIFGTELFRFNGIGGPQFVMDIALGNWDAFGSVVGGGFGILNDNLIFSAKLGGFFDWAQLFRYNIPTGKITIDTFMSNSNAEISGYITYHDKVYFAARDPSSGYHAFWYTDGVNKPVKVANAYPIVSQGGDNMIVFKDWLYFTGSERFKSTELYRYHDTKPNEIQSVAFDAVIKVYPNPTRSHLTIEMNLEKPKILHIYLTDITGRIVYSAKNTRMNSGIYKQSISLATLASGAYYCCVNDANGQLLYGTFIVKE